MLRVPLSNADPRGTETGLCPAPPPTWSGRLRADSWEPVLGEQGLAPSAHACALASLPKVPPCRIVGSSWSLISSVGGPHQLPQPEVLQGGLGREQDAAGPTWHASASGRDACPAVELLRSSPRSQEGAGDHPKPGALLPTWPGGGAAAGLSLACPGCGMTGVNPQMSAHSRFPVRPSLSN